MGAYTSALCSIIIVFSVGLVPVAVAASTSRVDVVLAVAGEVQRAAQLSLLLQTKDVVVNLAREDVLGERRGAVATDSVAGNCAQAQHEKRRFPLEEDSLGEGSACETKSGSDPGQSAHVLQLDPHHIEFGIAEVFGAVEQLFKFA